MSITPEGGGASDWFFFSFRNIVREVETRKTSRIPRSDFFFLLPRSPARLFESRSHLLIPSTKRIVDLTCYVYYEIITQSLLTRCQQSVSFFFFLFFWLTHAISHRNIVYLRSKIPMLSLFLPFCFVYRFSLSLSLSLPLILTFGRFSLPFLPGSLLHFVPIARAKIRKTRFPPRWNDHPGEIMWNFFPVPPFSFYLPPCSLSLFLYTTAPLS